MHTEFSALLYFSLLSPQFSGDDPDEETLSQYTSSSKENPGWGPLFQRVKEENGIASQVVNFQQGFSKRHFFQRGVSNLQDLLKCQLTVLFVDPFVLNLCFALSFSVYHPKERPMDSMSSLFAVCRASFFDA